MSLTAFPFDSRIVSYDADGLPIYDRTSNAEDFAKLLSSFFVSGVFGSSMCEVLQSDGMRVTVGAGQALIEGRFGNITSPETVTLPGSEGLNRIDTVVLRLDLSSAVNYIVADVVKGTAATNPTAPALTRNGTVWELGLANILVPANSTAVSQANITDTRLNDARCGLVAAVLTDVDTTQLYDQIQAELAHFKAVEEQGLRDFIASIEGMLEGDVAANLAAQVATLDATKTESAAQTVTLAATGWAQEGELYTQTAAVAGVTADAARVHVIPSPAPEAFEAYAEATVRATAQGDGTVTFTAASAPEGDLAVNVLVLDSGVMA